MNESEAIAAAQVLFLNDDNIWGCAETAFIVLKTAYGLPDSADSSAAMALNGGVAHSGGTCSAISGAAMAVGLLAATRIADHREAKRAARQITARLMGEFEAVYGSTGCRDLIGMEIWTEEGHRAFIEGGIWRDRCMRQIEFVVRRLLPLADEATWQRVMDEVGAP
ncbi:MAG: GCAxxG family protein [Chloroflexi bacterium]|nr:GCAxxG family protein [Chloroflexota bacterium]